jgi:hypothetical protein
LEVLSFLKLAVAQLRLYPKSSPQVVKTGQAAYTALARQLDIVPSLVLCQTPRGLLVDGQKLSAKDFATITLEASVVSLLLEAGVRSITFRKGLAPEELVTFLEALTRKFWDVREGKEINRLLREHRVVSIAVDEVEYVALSDGDLVIKDAARKLESGGSLLAELLRSLEKLTDAAVDPETSAEARLAIMRRLVEQDPSLLLRAQKEGYEALGDQKPGFVTLEKTRQAVGAIARLLPRCGSTETRELLRGIGHVFADAFAHDPKESALLRGLLGLDVAEITKAVEKRRADESAPVARTRELLDGEPDAQADALIQEAEPLLRELTALGRHDLAARLLARLTAHLVDRQAARRLAATEALLGMTPVWDAPPLAVARDGFESLVRSALEGELEPRVYSRLSDLGVLLADLRLRRGEYEQALELLAVFRKHFVIKDARFPHRPEQSVRALERLASSQGFPDVAAKLRAGDPVAIRIVEALDQAATRFLVAEIKKAESAPQRLQLAEILARIGSSAGAVFAEELHKTTAPSDTLRLLEVLHTAVSESVAVVALGSLLHHPALAVRRRTAGILSDHGYPRAGDLLLEALARETEPSIRVGLLEGLGRLRHLGARDAALGIADSRQEPDEVRAAACATLGRIGHADAIPVLAGLTAKSPRGITGILRPTSLAVRQAALRALGAFRAHPAAREALRKATEDSDAGLQAAARELLFAPIQEAVAEARDAAAAQDAKAVRAKLAGSLTEIPIDQVCQLIAGAEKTGLLMITFDGPAARIWFEDGVVTAAEFQGRLDQAAFNAFISHKKGQFVFQPGEIAPKRRVRLAVAMALLEAFRVADEGSPA